MRFHHRGDCDYDDDGVRGGGGVGMGMVCRELPCWPVLIPVAGGESELFRKINKNVQITKHNPSEWIVELDFLAAESSTSSVYLSFFVFLRQVR